MTRKTTSNAHIESQIALMVGGDLDDESQLEVERRVASCPFARSCHEELRDSLEVLHRCRDEHGLDESAGSPNLWLRLASRLPSRTRRNPFETLRPWVPAITVAALVLAIATVATYPPPRTLSTPPVADSPSWGAPWQRGVRPASAFEMTPGLGAVEGRQAPSTEFREPVVSPRESWERGLRDYRGSHADQPPSNEELEAIRRTIEREFRRSGL